VNKSFLGRGFRFPPSVNEKGNVALSEEEDNIREALQIILGTVRGERVMQPDFGCDIHELVFHPNTPSTCALVSHYVTVALRKWEPRITEIQVDARPDFESENQVNVRVGYRVVKTNTLDNLVFPFYLRREQDL
jgi:phage baseplate assembly protein W